MVRLAIPLVLLLVGCAVTSEERWRLYNDDGVQLFARAEYRDALDNFDLALTLRPDDPVLIFNNAQCYDRLGDHKKAEQFYTYCLQREPKYADARLALITMQHRAGRTTDAKKSIDDWFREDAASAEPYIADAYRLRQEKAYPEAHARLHQALSLDPTNRRAQTELAVLYEGIGMPDRSYALYEWILSRDPNQVEIADRLEQLKAKGIRQPLPN